MVKALGGARIFTCDPASVAVHRSVDGETTESPMVPSCDAVHNEKVNIDQQSSPAISVRGLKKIYGTREAVDGLDLDVNYGEVFALLGPNGAGKTTTVEILEGYRRRTEGDVSVLGHDPANVNGDWRDRVGLVLQSSKIADEATVDEVIRHHATFYRQARSVDEVVGLVGLDDKRGDRVAKLSGGQQRRLDVALGIVGRPELLFLDEPTTGFDPEARREFWRLIERLRDEGTTILLTTHYLDEAEVLADRVGVIVSGRMVDVGPPATLGGRALAGATVRWTGVNGPESVVTDAPTALVNELARTFDGEAPDLVVARPSLEDVYLRMIGVQQ